MQNISTLLLFGNLSNIGFQIYYISMLCNRESHPAISTIICHPRRKCPTTILVTTGNSLLFSFLYEYTLVDNGYLHGFIFLYANIGAMFLTKHSTYLHNIIAGNIFLNMTILMYFWSIEYGSHFYIFPISSFVIGLSISHKVIRAINKTEVPNILQEETIYILLFLLNYTNIHYLRVSPEKIKYT
jgi:hypothetical protein